MFNSGLNSFYPYQSIGTKRGLFSLFKGKLNWGNILNNTQKTLNIINQAIPVFYQVKPIFNNTKTIFKIMGALKEDDKKSVNTRPREAPRLLLSVRRTDIPSLLTFLSGVWATRIGAAADICAPSFTRTSAADTQL